jgi:predicted CxxxxCH...CXXCH cytochrome family protein
MEAYFNTADQREWIYDGVRWVPHDQGVDGYDASEKKGTEATQATELPRAALTVPFSPTGAHPKHRAYECTTCHLVGGSPCLDPAGLAAAPARPAPAFDATAKTCSSVSCHGAYAGTFTYVRWDYGLDDFETVTVPYAGSGGAAGSWFTPGSTCTSCHGNPPDPTRNWHSPYHAPAMAAGRKCETCHPDATSAVVGGATVGVSINATYAAQHANGVVNVQAKFTSKCFGCH